MEKKRAIQTFFTFLLLVLFAVSITPKIYFHEVIANHKDTASSCDHPKNSKACLHQKHNDCHVDDLVVTTPYLSFQFASVAPVHFVYRDFDTVYISSFVQDCLVHKESRGPPQA